MQDDSDELHVQILGEKVRLQCCSKLVITKHWVAEIVRHISHRILWVSQICLPIIIYPLPCHRRWCTRSSSVIIDEQCDFRSD